MIKSGPKFPKDSWSAACTYGAPCSSWAGAIPDDKHIIAVAVHNSSVSINTDNICTNPCLIGWLTCADAEAFGADPIPASLE